MSLFQDTTDIYHVDWYSSPWKPYFNKLTSRILPFPSATGNLIKVWCAEEELEGKTFTHVSPEGVHQDGFDHIAMIGVERCNIEGGDLMAYVSKDSDPFLIHQLQPGEMLMLNDRELWHNATPIKRITATAGYGDWFVLCAKA